MTPEPRGWGHRVEARTMVGVFSGNLNPKGLSGGIWRHGGVTAVAETLPEAKRERERNSLACPSSGPPLSQHYLPLAAHIWKPGRYNLQGPVSLSSPQHRTEQRKDEEWG